jgi:chaperonin cofactor prefoldin
LRGVKSLAAVSAENTESEVLAQELESVGNQLRAVEARLTEVEKIIERLEAAALTTARALEEVSTHWDKVYRAMRRAE